MYNISEIYTCFFYIELEWRLERRCEIELNELM